MLLAQTPVIGIDLGGTKIAARALLADGSFSRERRCATPRDDYDATVRAIGDLVADMANHLGAEGPVPVGVAIPGSIAPATGLIQNANSTWLNGRPLETDLATHLKRPVRLANDANCFALSEATDGAAAGARSVFGVIIGTGCGGALVLDGQVLDGPRASAGEWGHVSLPWPRADEVPGPACWCGKSGCLETWLSGPALARDHAGAGVAGTAQDIAAATAAGDAAAIAAIERYCARLARGLAMIVNILDPDVIVLGGGLSQICMLYERVPPLAARFIFADNTDVDLRPPKWGDASGVRGAAWLWRGPGTDAPAGAPPLPV